ncbi:MAG: hypothetical protein GF398_21560 [Chitinivibrionales bacterium]|nr:hypothetical protein [Chitinivibrionales bacterium]
METTSHVLPKLPKWQIVYVADLCGGKSGGAAQSVDKYSLNDLFKALKPTLAIPVKNELGTPAPNLDVELLFTQLKDFEPDGLMRQVLELRALVEVKEVLDKFHKAKITRDECARKITGLTLPPRIRAACGSLLGTGRTDASRSSCAVDDILGMMGLDDAEPTPPAESSPVEALAKAASDAPKVPASGDVAQLFSKIDAVASRQLDAIVHESGFVELERVWREVALLVERTDFKRGVEVRVLAGSREALRDLLVQHVFKPAWSEGMPAPDAVILSFPLSASAVDLELIADLAKLGQSTQTLMLCACAPAFFGVQHWRQIASNVGSVQTLVQRQSYVHWRDFIAREEADWLALVAGAFALRLPFSGRTARISSIAYNESTDRDRLPCASGAVAAGLMLSENLGRLGTDRVYDSGDKACVADLPAPSGLQLDSKTVASPLADIWQQGLVHEMIDAGLAPLYGEPDLDEIVLAASKTCKLDGASIPRAVIGGYLSRLALAIAESKRKLPDDQLQQLIYATILKRIAADMDTKPPDAVGVSVGPHPAQDSARACYVHVCLPYRVMGHEIVVQFGFGF